MFPDFLAAYPVLINVIGSADANATARATGNEQSRVVSDLTRNFTSKAQ
jgi:hypothetical protein